MIARFVILGIPALVCAGSTAMAATFGELSAARPTPAPTCPPYCPVPQQAAPPQTVPSMPPAAARPYAYAPAPEGTPPLAPDPRVAPGGQIPVWSYGQITTMSNPYNPWGLTTPFMYVPWSTPLSGWTNATTWNWWRERSVAPPPNW